MAPGSAGPGRDHRHEIGPDVSSLHRDAVMLTGATDAADRLVRATLQHAAPPGASPLEALVREYLRHAPHREAGLPRTAGRVPDPDDVLGSLRPRERAAAVLVLVEGWSGQDAARALGVRPERVPSLVPRTEGLADALRALAYHHDEPAHDLGPPRRGGRRGAATLAVAGLVAVGLVVAVLLGTDDAGRARGDDADGPTARSGGLAGRGWVLGPEDDPPSFLEGLRLIDVRTIDYADPALPLVLDTVPRKGRVMYAALWCDMPPAGADLVLPTVALTLSGSTVQLACAGRHDDPPLDRLVPLPPPTQAGRTPVSVRWAGDLPGRGSAVLATYTEFGQNQPSRSPLAVRHVPPPVPDDAAALDDEQMRTPVEGGALSTLRVTVSSQTRLSLWCGGTGRFRVLVDGIVASDDGDLAQPRTDSQGAPAWQDQHPQVRHGVWTAHAPGESRQFLLPRAVRPPPGETREVTVQVGVDTGSEGPWQVQLSHATGRR